MLARCASMAAPQCPLTIQDSCNFTPQFATR
jgi:hypothetical protein